jgi:hypothetical protein
MVFLTRLLWRFLCFCALCFVFLSVVYTTEFLLSFSVASLRLSGFATPPSSVDTSVTGLKRTISEHQVQGGSIASAEDLVNISQPALPLISQRILANRASTAPSFGWASSEITLKHGLGHPGTITVDERTMLAKAFATSMRPSSVLPYFYRASGSFKRDDITITTLVTSNRFEVLARLVKKYKGLPRRRLLLYPIDHKFVVQDRFQSPSTSRTLNRMSMQFSTLCMTCTLLRNS